MTTNIAEYTATEAALADFRTKYRDAVFSVTTAKGMTEAKQARAELREHRVSLEKERVRIKAPALERCRQIDSEAKRINAALEALESPIDAQIKTEEQRKEREKAERERIERERIEALNKRFDAIRALPLAAIGASSDDIILQIDSADAIDLESFPEDVRAAVKYEKRVAIAALRAALDRALTAEEEAERIKAERAELEKLRAEVAAAQAEKDRLAQIERDRLAAETRAREEAEHAERVAAEQAERVAREAEQARIDAERVEARRKEDAERAAAAEKLREEQEEIARERARFEAEIKEKAKRDREHAIAAATLESAAAEALDLLCANGFSDHIVTEKLRAALGHTQQKAAA